MHMQMALRRNALAHKQRGRWWRAPYAPAFASPLSTSATQRPLRVLFFGTDDVAVATLRRLYDNSQEMDPSQRIVQELHVICPTDRKVGKSKRTDPVPTKRFAMAHDLPVTHTPAHLKSLRTWEPEVAAEPFDVGVVVSFGYMLHPHLLRSLRYGAINMHPSLLPKYRGPAPIHHALRNGDSTTGISVIEIDPSAFDVGRILWQREHDIPRGITTSALATQLAEAGADAILTTLRELETRKREAVPQSDALASHAPKITLQDGFLSLRESADAVFHLWQALSDDVGVSVRYNDKDVKLVTMQRPESSELEDVNTLEQRACAQATRAQPEQAQPSSLPSGAFLFDKKRNALWLKCASETWVLVTSLQPADRKVGDALDFANGNRFKHGALGFFEPITTPE